MNTFILEIRNLDYHTLRLLNKSIMNLSLITLGDLETLGISALI
jgi:hypothetical protein